MATAFDEGPGLQGPTLVSGANVGETSGEGELFLGFSVGHQNY